MVSTVAVFLVGLFQGCFFSLVVRESQFNGWEKIKVKQEIETAVKKFYVMNVSCTNCDMRERTQHNDGEVV